MDLPALLDRVPPGWTRVTLDDHPYGLVRRDRVGGRVISIWAEQLDGPAVISANVWRTGDGLLLRPCEMPAATVLDFLSEWQPEAVDSGA